jgi:hypothetical protein
MDEQYLTVGLSGLMFDVSMLALAQLFPDHRGNCSQFQFQPVDNNTTLRLSQPPAIDPGELFYTSSRPAQSAPPLGSQGERGAAPLGWLMGTVHS